MIGGDDDEKARRISIIIIGVSAKNINCGGVPVKPASHSFRG